ARAGTPQRRDRVARAGGRGNRSSRSPAVRPLEQHPDGNALAFLAYAYICDRLRDQAIERLTHERRHRALPERFALPRLHLKRRPVADVLLHNRRQPALGHLPDRDRDPLPIKRPTDLAFEDSTGVLLDLAALMV